MRNLISSMMVALDGFLGSANRHGHSLDDSLAEHANDLLIVAEGLLALLLLFAGGVKLVMPLGVLMENIPLPGMLVRFIGVAEILVAAFFARFLRIRTARSV
jgi:hypothetical protein